MLKGAYQYEQKLKKKGRIMLNGVIFFQKLIILT